MLWSACLRLNMGFCGLDWGGGVLSRLAWETGQLFRFFLVWLVGKGLCVTLRNQRLDMTRTGHLPKLYYMCHPHTWDNQSSSFQQHRCYVIRRVPNLGFCCKTAVLELRLCHSKCFIDERNEITLN